MPTFPTDAADISSTLVDLGESFSSLSGAESSNTLTVAPAAQNDQQSDGLPELLEASGWQRDKNNQVVLTARSPQEQLTLQATARCVG